MSHAVMNFSSLDHFSAESKDYENDLEVEDILNEMGFFANDDGEFSDGLFGGEHSEGYHITTSDGGLPPNFYAPVSPHQCNGQVMADTIPSTSNVTISPSSSVEDMQTFSVPNPIGTMSASFMPAPIAPKSYGYGNYSDNNNSQEITKRKTPKKETTRSSRKRKAPTTAETVIQEVTLHAPSPIQDDVTSADDEDLTEEQLEERRQRNREHAKRSRQRKKSLTCTLQQSVDDLKEENSKLREQIYAMIGYDKVESILEARREKARIKFMDGLMQPSSRILDNDTLAFLKGLRKGIPTDASASIKKQKRN